MLGTKRKLIREVETKLRRNERGYLPLEYSNQLLVKFDKNEYPVTMHFNYIFYDDCYGGREVIHVKEVIDKNYERLLKYIESQEFLNAINKRIGGEMVESIKVTENFDDYSEHNLGSGVVDSLSVPKEEFLKLNDKSPNSWVFGFTFFFSREITEKEVEAYLKVHAKTNCCNKEILFEGPLIETHWTFNK